MANEEQLKLLLQSVEQWNDWKGKNFGVEIDLSEADLTGANLIKADLTGANLTGANLIGASLKAVNLSEADLSKANFIGANLIGAYLSGANLSGAYLSGAYLGGAKLRTADLRGADLRATDLRGANLRATDLRGANLNEANLSEAKLNRVILSRAQLRGANFSKAYLIGANFSEANLSEANLSEAILSGVSLIRANLSKAILSGAYLMATQALGTNFKEATFTGTCIEDWNINSETNIEQVNCEYIFLKHDRSEDKFTERRPHDPNKKFAPGEFTKLFQKVVETVDLIFKDGIDWKAFLASFQKLQVECGSDELSIQAIEKKSGGAFVIRVEVPADANKAEVEKYLKREYEYQLKAIEEKYRLQLDLKEEQLTFYRQQSADLMEVVKVQASRPIQNVIENQNIQDVNSRVTSMSKDSKYDLSNAKVYGFAPEAKDSNVVSGETVKDNTIVGTQHNYAPEKQDLAEAAAEIQQLLSQLSQTYPTTTLVEQAVVAEKAIQQIEDDPTLKQRVIAALKAGTIEAFMEIIDNPVVNVMRATLEAWQEGE